MTMPKRLALIMHDFVAHPLIAITNGAAWAWKLHDVVGEMATSDQTAITTIAGRPDIVQQVAEDLRAAGWEILDTHWHGSQGRGQMVVMKTAKGAVVTPAAG
jgi:hypothetical protein